MHTADKHKVPCAPPRSSSPALACWQRVNCAGSTPDPADDSVPAGVASLAPAALCRQIALCATASCAARYANVRPGPIVMPGAGRFPHDQGACHCRRHTNRRLARRAGPAPARRHRCADLLLRQCPRVEPDRVGTARFATPPDRDFGAARGVAVGSLVVSAATLELGVNTPPAAALNRSIVAVSTAGSAPIFAANSATVRPLRQVAVGQKWRDACPPSLPAESCRDHSAPALPHRKPATPEYWVRADQRPAWPSQTDGRTSTH